MLKKKTSTPPSVGMAATSGIAWTMVQTFCGKMAVFVGQLILAKILTPEDFGVLGLAYTITIFFGVLSDMGISQTLQQRHPHTHFWATQAFWMSFAVSTIAAIAMAIYAPIGAKLYHNEKVVDLIWVLALNLPLCGLTALPNVRLQSSLKFNFIATYGSIELITTQIMTILLAWNGFGSLSFVLPIPLLSLIRVIVYWTVAPVPRRPIRASRGWSIMLKRSSGIFGSTILAIVINQGDYITLGLLTSATVVGIYFFAFRLAAQPMLTLATSFTNVLRPALVALKSDRLRQRDAALRTAELLGLLIVPLCFVQIPIARPGLTLLFGSRWLDCVPLIQILSIGLPFDAISWAAGSLLGARGQNARAFKYRIISVPFFFILVGAGALMASSLGVAIGVTIYYAINSIFFTTLIFAREGIGIRRILALFYIPFTLATVTIGGAYFISLAPILQNRLAAQIAITMILGGVAYILAVRRFVPHFYRDIRIKLWGLLKRSPSFS